MMDFKKQLEAVGGTVEEWDWDWDGRGWDGWPLTKMGFFGMRPEPIHYKCYRTKYANGYGASIVKHPGTYGYEDGLWELAVIKWEDDNWHLNYDTPITNDVVGYLTEDDVIALCKRIKNLSENGEEEPEHASN